MKEFKKGERVRIFNQKLSGDEFEEGEATVIKKIGNPSSWYKVRFDDGFITDRYIDPFRQKVGVGETP